MHPLYHTEHHSVPTQKVEEKLEQWVDKYENDMDAKDEELHALNAAKANNLEELKSLAKEVRAAASRCSAVLNCIPAFPALLQIRNQNHGEKDNQ